ncbi:MAG TPA: thiamine phosphate synthase [Flavobacteriales bacterium]|nr:thiamine phosphate synthase [Flavobacteriales bacterium]
MTRLIVISSENDIAGEIRYIHNLFEQGMELFHLRKPHWTAYEQETFLKRIDSCFYPKISLHQHHEQAMTSGLNHIHMHAMARETNGDKMDEPLNCIKSTSFHSYAEIISCRKNFDYAFLSPVFTSISKPGYTQNIDPDLIIDQRIPVKIFGLGGINSRNAQSVLARGFYGVAVLGSIWNDPAKACANFNELKNVCNNNVHMY